MSEEYKIEKGIPVVQQSRPRKPASALTKALRAMDVGDSIKANLAETRASLAATMRRDDAPRRACGG